MPAAIRGRISPGRWMWIGSSVDCCAMLVSRHDVKENLIAKCGNTNDVKYINNASGIRLCASEKQCSASDNQRCATDK